MTSLDPFTSIPKMPPDSVFVSYSREDADLAESIIAALRHDGLSVWWDGLIPAAVDFDRAIDVALHRAGCTVVLWTEQSVESRWVRAEARAALEAGTLLSVLVGSKVRRPVEFSGVQGLDFRGGRARLDGEELRAVVLGVRSVLGQIALRSVRRRRSMARRVAIGIALVAALVAVASTWLIQRRVVTITTSLLTVGGSPHDVVLTNSATWFTDNSRQLVWRRGRGSAAAQSIPVPGAWEIAQAPNGAVTVSSSVERSAIRVIDDHMNPRTIDTGAVVEDMAMSDDMVWVVQTAAGRVTAVDVESGTQVWARSIVNPLSVLHDANGLWVTAAPDGAGELLRLDGADGRVLGRVASGKHPVGLASLGSTVWVADQLTGNVDAYDTDLRPVATVPAGARLVDLASDGRRIWASSSASSEIVVIDPHSAKVVARHALPVEPFKIDGLNGVVAAVAPLAGKLIEAHTGRSPTTCSPCAPVT